MGSPLKLLRTQKGQVSVMVGAMMMTFLFFFAFVINVGMLVNAKINLQNAADLAAYAGAAVQARQLTRISYLNYEMRRQWKKYLFRIYVLGNMSQDGFPKSPGSGGMKYQPNADEPSVLLPAPSTCMIFTANNNYCHVNKLPKIANISSAIPGEGITEALKAQLDALEKIRQNNCKAIGITNQILNLLWTFNTDPSALAFTQSSSSVNAFLKDAGALVRSYAKGLGIVPRELILKFRIQTLQDYVNSPAIRGLTLKTASQLNNRADPAAVERSIQAFFSAFYTLGNHTFPTNTIVMDELLPGDTTKANLLRLTPLGTAFDIYAVDLDFASDTDSSCLPKLYATSITNPLTLGFAKDESIQTYYAIRLQAKARLLFSPFGDLDLKAYAAAKPFGSRIGPAATDVGFSSASNVTGSPTGKSPNLSVRANEGGSSNSGVNRGSGWDTKSVIGTMFSVMITGASNNSGSVQVPPYGVERAYSTAMAPNPWESGRYNIFNSTFDTFQGEFATGTSTEGGFAMKYMMFWAPIFPPEKIGQIRDQLKGELDTLFDPNNTQGSIRTASGGGPLRGLKGQIMGQLEQYISSLQPSAGGGSNLGENGETINIAVLTDPFMRLSSPNNLEQISGSSAIFLPNDPKQLKTSWNFPKNGDLQREGRDGYSVKFVSFSSLGKNKTGSWTNDIRSVGDPEMSKDLQKIQH